MTFFDKNFQNKFTKLSVLSSKNGFIEGQGYFSNKSFEFFVDIGHLKTAMKMHCTLEEKDWFWNFIEKEKNFFSKFFGKKCCHFTLKICSTRQYILMPKLTFTKKNSKKNFFSTPKLTFSKVDHFLKKNFFFNFFHCSQLSYPPGNKNRILPFKKAPDVAQKWSIASENIFFWK